jgi:O-antigen ligase/Tfp pilus assembly protein PilF
VRQPKQQAREAAVADRTADRLERAAAVAAGALVLVRPLFPSEDAAEGSGLLVVALWGVVAVLWSAAQWARGQVRVFAGVADLSALVLLASVLASVAWADARRPALIMASEWTALVLSYFLVRQLFRNSGTRHALVLTLLAAAVSLATYGIYQVFWGLQPLRAEYLRDPARVLEAIGIAPGSPQEQSFKNRLMSHEPFATFALANSLAGFLVAWLPVGLAWLFRRDGVAGHWTGAVGAGVGMLAIALCLVLTQSRTAYAAFLVQTTLLALTGGMPLLRAIRQRATRPWVWVAVIAVMAVLAVVLFEAKRLAKIDIKLVTQATKSLGYRWQYWGATADLVRDHWWTGVGPGNFRGHYLKYKRAESSEEIADPHNMVLELLATSGVIGGVALVFTLAAALWRAGQSSVAATSPATESEGSGVACRQLGVGMPTQSRGHGTHEIKWTHDQLDWHMLFAVGAGGWIAASVLASLDLGLLCLLGLGWCLAAASLAVVGRHSSLGPRTFAVAALGLAVHLLGAGGIGMPGVAQSLWVLLALGLNASEACEPWIVRSAWPARVLMIATTSVAVWFGLRVLRPVTEAQSALAIGRWRFSHGDLAAAEAQFQAAARSDPQWVEPWLELSRIHYQRWRSGRRRALEPEFELASESLRRASQVAPRELESWRLAGELLAARGRRDQSTTWWSRAAGAFQACVNLYPTSASLRARLADSLWQAGEADAARQEMRRALELDAGTPHLDKKLTAEERAVIEQRLSGGRG